MARQRGSLSLPGNFEVGSSASLDARLTAKTLADLNSSNYPFAYKGMLVYVEETDKYYKLTKATVTSANDFVEFSGGGSSTVDTDLDETSANPVQNKAIAVPVNELTASMVGVKSRLDALEDDVDAVSGKFFVAEYNVTTSQELLAYLARTNEPFAQIVVKRGNDYYTSILSAPSGDSAIVMVLGSGGGDFHIFTYTVTEAVWANSGHTLQKKLVSGTDIKTINSESLLGSGDIELPTPADIDQIELDIADLSASMLGVQARLDDMVPIKSIGNGLVYDDTTGELSATATGSAVTETAITVSNPIGRFTMNEVIPAGTPLEEIDRKLLQKVSVPTLTDPKAILTFTAPTLVKVGTTVSGGNATVTLDRGSINPAYGTSGYRSGEATGYAISMTGAAASYSDNNDTGQFTVPDITRATPGKVTITGTASYAAGEQPKDSDGANYSTPLGAGSKSATKEIEFIAPFYYGATQTKPRTDLAGLTEDLSKKGAKTYTVATNSEYVTFAYDASYGDLRSIKDEGDQENIDGYTKTQITVDGIAYNLYISQFLTVDPAAVYKLSF